MNATDVVGPEKVNILLVDDQPGKLMSYELILQGLGQNLLKANSARQALELLLKNEIAVILVDVCMPDLDGFELAQMIREHPRFRQIAIIFISAINITELDSLRGYELGAVDYVPVPVVPGVLRAKVGVFVDLYVKTRTLARMNDALEMAVAERTKELETAIARQELLAREVDHRARNALAVIQSIVSLTSAPSPTEYASAIKGRIRAMACAHTLLSDARWEGADMLQLVNEELAPYGLGDRVSVSGPALDILPTAAQTIALAVHELATNAAKYGALSHEKGQLSVVWFLEEDALVLGWTEETAEPVKAPTRTGFGSRLLKSSIEGQLEGRLEAEWPASGLRMRLRIPQRHFVLAGARFKEPNPEPQWRPTAPRQRLIDRRILIVEDEPLVAMMMAQLVRDLGATVVGPHGTIRDAAESLNEDLDAALLDINVGDDLVYPIAAALVKRRLPVVFVTGYQPDSIAPEFRGAQVLTKPIEAEMLASALLAAISPRLLDA